MATEEVLSFPGSRLSGDDRNLAALKYLDELFSYKRFNWENVGCFRTILFVLYFPLGVMLILVRGLVFMPLMAVLASLQCTSFCLPRSWHTVLFRLQLVLWLGLSVRVVGSPLSSANVWVANHLSEFDACAIRAIADPYILGYGFYQDLWWLKCSPLNLFKMLYIPQQGRSEGGSASRDKINEAIAALVQGEDTLLLFPEGGLTNSRVGLLQYHKRVFSLGKTIQPIALSLSSPFPFLHVDTMTASFRDNLLWFLFLPFCTYTVEFLSPVSIDESLGETPLEFARRTMALTAASLGIRASPFLYADKRRWGRLKSEMEREGLVFEIALSQDESRVLVKNMASGSGVLERSGAVQPMDSVSSGVDAQAHRSDRDILLSKLYDCWNLRNEGVSHLVFAPSSASSPPVASDSSGGMLAPHDVTPAAEL